MFKKNISLNFSSFLIGTFLIFFFLMSGCTPKVINLTKDMHNFYKILGDEITYLTQAIKEAELMDQPELFSS